MMKDIFIVNLFPPYETDGDTRVNLTLPAAPYELIDALDKLRLKAGAVPHWEIVYYHAHNWQVLDTQGTIYELNALAEKLSELDESSDIAYDGLMDMEKGPVPISRMIDLAYSTGCCQVVTEARDEMQLGMFCVRNGLIPEVEGLSEEQLSLLDYVKIGWKQCRSEGGVFVKRNLREKIGYVVQRGELTQAYQGLDLTLRQPDYSFLLRIGRGYYAPPASDCKKAVQLKLPAGDDVLESVLSDLKVNDWKETAWRGLDCRVPQLTDMICDIGGSDVFSGTWMRRINDLAQSLADMDAQTLSTYKALLSATDCSSLQQAEQRLLELDQYVFSPQYSSLADVAKGKLTSILCDAERMQILPHLDLCRYGQSLIQHCGGVLTGYGLLERTDGQPVQVMDESPRQGGMEMWW